MRTPILSVAVAAILSVAPATAKACTLTLNNGGTMGLSSDGVSLGSEIGSGTGAALAVASLGSATVEVAAPALIETPSGYDDSQDVAFIRYSGLGGLGGVDQAYTDQTTSFSIGLLPLSILVMNALVTNPNAFAAGNYRLRTVVTCY